MFDSICRVLLSMKTGMEILKEIVEDLVDENEDSQAFKALMLAVVEKSWELRYHPSHTKLSENISI